MSSERKNVVHVPPPSKDGDSRDSSLIVYTLTVAIAVALLVAVLTINEGDISKLSKKIAACILTLSIILTFIAIEFLVDIVSFGESEANRKSNVRKCKYKRVLLFYNFSVILIISSILLLIYCYVCNNTYSCGTVLICIIVWIFSTRKWWVDILYLFCKMNLEDKKKLQYEIVSAEKMDSLSNKINDKINDGWECIGSTSASTNPLMYFQAIIKEQ